MSVPVDRLTELWDSSTKSGWFFATISRLSERVYWLLGRAPEVDDDILNLVRTSFLSLNEKYWITPPFEPGSRNFKILVEKVAEAYIRSGNQDQLILDKLYVLSILFPGTDSFYLINNPEGIRLLIWGAISANKITEEWLDALLSLFGMETNSIETN